MPGLIRGLLRGGGPAALQNYLKRTGAVMRVADDLGALAEMPKLPGSFKERIIPGAVRTVFGYKPVEALKQRFIQGGIAGRGGLIRGAFAPDAAFTRDARQHGGYLKAMWENKKENLPHAFSAGVNTAVLAGMPAYGTYKALERGDNPGLAYALGEGVGWTLANPFGFAGMPVAIATGIASRDLVGPRLPQIHAFDPTYADMLGSSGLGPAKVG